MATHLERNSVPADLCGFASRLLTQCGGLVEWDSPDEIGTAMVPKSMANLLHTQEEFSLSTKNEKGSLPVSLGSEFLDQSELVLNTFVPRLGLFTLPALHLKGRNLQDAIDRQFSWQNVRVRVGESAPSSTEYHLWSFFCTLKSEDVWESMLHVAVNTLTQAPVALPELPEICHLQPSDEPFSATPDDTAGIAQILAQRRMLALAHEFTTRMETRRERDRKRLRDYYGALLNTDPPKRKNLTPPSPEQLADRNRVVQLELQRKLAELDDRYEMEGVITPVTMASLKLNNLAVEIIVQRRRNERQYQIFWNPLIKQFEPLACSRCGDGIYSLAFTDEDVAPLCTTCFR